MRRKKRTQLDIEERRVELECRIEEPGHKSRKSKVRRIWDILDSLDAPESNVTQQPRSASMRG